MRVKGNTYKANQPPLRTIVVEQDGKFITHRVIYERVEKVLDWMS